MVKQLDEAVMHIAEAHKVTVILGRIRRGDDDLWHPRLTNAGHPPPPRHRGRQTTPRHRHRPAASPFASPIPPPRGTLRKSEGRAGRSLRPGGGWPETRAGPLPC
nr:serine/threonine-protein phosphatase [Streptomyces sp. M1013]